jgi:hypothetical protein
MNQLEIMMVNTPIEAACGTINYIPQVAQSMNIGKSQQ